jgi:glycosidase
MEKIVAHVLTLLLVSVAMLTGCTDPGQAGKKPFTSEVVHPAWSEDMVLYEVNIRQYTPEGTFNAFTGHLPRLKDLGIDVLWLMPVHPIGEINRKGTLGSYYSVKDFMAVNPEFGTMDDFKALIDSAHDMDMHVLLDWVPNHSAWDNPLTTSQPGFYAKDSNGRFMPPKGTDWTDVIQFDWTNEELHDYMIKAMAFWVSLGVDGFRVDHPHNTPPAFWERARTELSAIRPVFMLAEHEAPGGFMVKGFDMNFSWELHHLLKTVVSGEANVSKVHDYFEKELEVYPQNVYRMQFLTNHDENSWQGTIDSIFGPAHKALADMIFTVRGVPLLYSGQEACLNKRLRFFDRDTIRWDTCNMTGYYQKLIKLKKENKALWNGESGGTMTLIKTDKDNSIFAYSRIRDGNTILVFLNLTGTAVSFNPRLEGIEGQFTDFHSGEVVTLPYNGVRNLGPWESLVFTADR